MFVKLLISLVFMYSSINASTKNNKFLVIDGNTFDMINNTNILDGGIKKRVVVSSNRLKKEDYKKYYAEYFLFKGEKCSILNAINVSKSNTMATFDLLIDKTEIKKEIKKLKLIQMLNDDSDTKGNYSRISKNIIKSLSLICNNKLIFRNKVYQKNSYIGKFKIEDIDFVNSILYIKE